MSGYSAHSWWQLLCQADRATQIVLAILMIMSLVCWSLFCYRYWLLRTMKQQMWQLLEYMRMMQTPDDLQLITQRYQHTVPGFVLTSSLQSLQALVELKRQQGEVGKLGVGQWERFQDTLHYAVDEALYRQESGMWVLSTCAAAATLLGLFGTVWGLVHAFMSMSSKKSVDLLVIAPGIAEALITTLAGLMVAIPALIMFNYLSRQLVRIQQQMNSLIQSINRIIQSMFVY